MLVFRYIPSHHLLEWIYFFQRSLSKIWLVVLRMPLPLNLCHRKETLHCISIMSAGSNVEFNIQPEQKNVKIT